MGDEGGEFNPMLRPSGRGLGWLAGWLLHQEQEVIIKSSTSPRTTPPPPLTHRRTPHSFNSLYLLRLRGRATDAPFSNHPLLQPPPNSPHFSTQTGLNFDESHPVSKTRPSLQTCKPKEDEEDEGLLFFLCFSLDNVYICGK